MRLAAQAKMGYYPVNYDTLKLVCSAIKIKDPGTVRILDPCCGEGLALAKIGEYLNIPKENLYGVELDDRRAEVAQVTLGDISRTKWGNVIHGSFFNARIVPVQSFSMAWVNPPYEDEIRQDDSGGNRQLEISFLQHVARYVIQNGVVVLHAPDDRISDAVVSTFHQMCYKPVRIKLPPKLRPYRESLLIGFKRSSIDKHQWSIYAPVMESLPELPLPSGDAIRVFKRSAPTDKEILDHLSKAKWKAFEDKKRGKLTPVLPLGAGHLGLTLASGYLDGLLKPVDCEPHVVRGIAYKEEELAKEETTESDDGKVTVTETYRQNIKLKIRAITGDGTIHEIK